MDNLGICRFHRLWAEEMMPEIMGSLFGMREQYLDGIAVTASRINSRNSSIFWESERSADIVHSYLRRKKEVEGDNRPELAEWLNKFEKDKQEAAIEFWYEMHKGIDESLREY
jgi:glyceraldehyde-3-phosphate dehydrogenase (ferredoxin)